MKPKQAEMAYYYIIRKLRKGMEAGEVNFELLLERAKAGDKETREEKFCQCHFLTSAFHCHLEKYHIRALVAVIDQNDKKERIL